MNLKKLNEQTMVITGASSGIGLTTARMAAKRGANLVLAARNEDALRQLTEEIVGNGGKAVFVVADVGDEAEIRKIAEKAQSEFGGFDTWVNNAGTGLFGRIMETKMEDNRRLFETNFWGIVYGSTEAAKSLKSRGGAIINLGSEVSERATALQGIYAASKHAVKGFTDALRMELEAENAPISVTLIRPAAIDTPFPQHAANYLPGEPTLPPPVYAPENVAEAILHSAETPERDIFIGSASKGAQVMNFLAPGLLDKAMETKKWEELHQQDGPAKHAPEGALYEPTFGLQERGNYPGKVHETSYYTKASMHPALTGTLIAGAALALAAGIAATRNGKA